MSVIDNTLLMYIPFLKNFFYVSGSVGRYRYKNKIMYMLTKVSDTLPALFEKENAEYAPHDLDLIYIDEEGNERLVNFLKKNENLEFIQIKKDLIMLRHKKKKIRIDIFICKKEYLYSYYLFTALGKRINIILRKKAIRANILLNQYGLFDRTNNKQIIIKYNKNKDIFYNMELLLKKIYSY
jgi:DNA polymerase/3'-5' exonuclease PolX